MDNDPWGSVRCYELKKVEKTGPELGRGAYGYVVAMRLDGCVPVAGKFLHSTISRGVPKDKFVAECHMLSKLHHPNIVQFLGLYWEEHAELPGIIMEQLPFSLSSMFTKRGKTIIPLNIKISLLLDVAEGLSYLHQKCIMHRDLSANNVLLTGSLRAKIADLGVARLITPEELHKIMHECESAKMEMTQVPGTPCFMPPEVNREDGHRVYSFNIDCFSFGVLVLFCCKQGNVKKCEEIQVTVEGHGTLWKKLEDPLESFKEDIAYLPDGHKLRDLAINCLDAVPKNRPTAHELVERLTLLHKEDPSPLRDPFTLLDSFNEVAKQRQENGDATERMSGESPDVAVHVDVKKNQIIQLEKEIEELVKKRDQQVDDCQLLELKQKNLRLEEDLKAAQETITAVIPPTLNASIKRDPTTQILVKKVSRLKHAIPEAQAVFLNGKVYIGRKTTAIWVYDAITATSSSSSQWKRHPKDAPVTNFAISGYQNKLVLIGGVCGATSRISKKVYVWKESGEWDEHVLPELSEEREKAVAVSYKKYLIVCGGEKKGFFTTTLLKSVEVCDGSCWQFASPLLQNGTLLQAVTSDRFLYILFPDAAKVHYCSIEALVLSSLGGLPEFEKNVWKAIPPSAYHSQCCLAVLGSYLLAVAGVDSKGEVFLYQPGKNQWTRINTNGSVSLTAVRNACSVNKSADEVLICGGDLDMMSKHDTHAAYSLRLAFTDRQTHT